MRVFYNVQGIITSYATVGWDLLETTDNWIDVDDSELATINSKQVNTTTFVLEDIPTYAADQLAAAKVAAKAKIDEMAGEARLRFITEVPGQALTYQEKAEEAADYVAAGYPVDTSNYPFIQAEIDATGLTKEEAADGILANKSAWIVWGAEIEKNRIGGKTQVEAAADIAAVDTIVANIQVLLDAIE